MDRRTALPVIVAAAALAVGSAGTAVAGHAAFSDASGTHEAGIHWLADTGVTGGCGGGRFCTEDAVKRGQMATFMHRLSGTAGVAPVVNADKVDGLDAEQLRGQQGPAGPQGDPGANGSNGISSAYTVSGGLMGTGPAEVRLVLPAGSAYVINGTASASGPAASDRSLECSIMQDPNGTRTGLGYAQSQTPSDLISVAVQGTLAEAATPTTVALECEDFGGGSVLPMQLTAVAVDVLENQNEVD